MLSTDSGVNAGAGAVALAEVSRSETKGKKILHILLDHDNCIASWSLIAEISKLATVHLYENAQTHEEFKSSVHFEPLKNLMSDFEGFLADKSETTAKDLLKDLTAKNADYLGGFTVHQYALAYDIKFDDAFYTQVKEAFVKHNKLLIDEVITRASEYDEVVFSIGSTRQNLENDITNSYKESVMYTGSAYIAIPAIVDAVQKSLETKKAQFSSVLLPDIIKETSVGHHFDDYVANLSFETDEKPLKKDTNKLSIVYAHTHHIAVSNPDATIDTILVDDQRSILENVSQILKAPEGQQYLPANVNFSTMQFVCGKFEGERSEQMSGSGPIQLPNKAVLDKIFAAARSSGYYFAPTPSATNTDSSVARAGASASESKVDEKPKKTADVDTNTQLLNKLEKTIREYISNPKNGSLTCWGGGKDVYIIESGKFNFEAVKIKKHYIVPKGIYEICKILQKAKKNIAKNGNETDALANALADIKLLVNQKFDNSFANLFAQTFIRTSSTQALYNQILNELNTNSSSSPNTQDGISPAA